MEDESLIICPHCGFEYKPGKSVYCPNCNYGKEKRHPLIRMSEAALSMPIGVKIAIIVTSAYAIYAITDLFFHLIWISIPLVAVYLGCIYVWVMKRDDFERPVWFLVLILLMYLPVLSLISLLIFL